MFADDSLIAAYRTETEHLTAQRLPSALGLCLGLIGIFGILEHARWPQHAPVFAAFYAVEVGGALALLGGQRWLQRRGALCWAAVALWSGVAVLIAAYGIAVALPAELPVLVSLCLVIAGSLLLPWGLRGQAVVAAASLAGTLAAVALQPAASAGPTAFLVFAMVAVGAIAVFGAYHLDLHRFAIFVETTRREEEAAVGQSLVAIAREINEALEATDVLDRIATVIRSALHASWSAIVLCDDTRDACVVVGTAGRVPDGIAGLRGVEFSRDAMPLVRRVLAEREVSLGDGDTDPATAGLLSRWQTRAVLGSVLLRRQQTIGILLAGAQGPAARFSERGEKIWRGIAQHVAIALNNVRLVADLRAANALKTDFLATMSHELRTPLNVILGYADLLRDEAFGALHGEQHEVLGRLRLNARSLLELIDATLEVNRLEAGGSGVQVRDVDLRALVLDLQDELEEVPRHPGVALRWEVPRSSAVVRTDALKLKIIVRNLVGNALKFTRRGHVAVQVGLDPRNRTIEAMVRDTGPGIPAEHLPHIFDMFHQAPTDASAGGVGLGLYIVRRFAELLGGRVSVTSDLGAGSAFRLSLPAGVMAAQPVSIDAHRRRRSA